MPNEIKKLLSSKVDSLLRLHKERDELQRQALELLKTEYAIRKITQKIENFLSLGWNEFMEELEKQHTLFSLQNKDELNIWFRGKQKMFKTMENNINKIDELIDAEVYKLYHLSNNDVQIVLRSIQHQNTPKNLLQAAA